MRLFDTHCHLQEPQIAPYLDGAMERAKQAGVVRLMCCGTGESDWERTKEIGRRHPGVLVSLGVHPWFVARRGDGWRESLEHHLLAGCSGVGEIGLDHAVEPRLDREQAKVFVAQIRLAARLKLPVSIHCRRAFGELLDILKSEGGVRQGGVLHSYSGAPEMVAEFERLGLSLSFSGSLTRPGNRRGRASVRAVSPDRLLIETDCPAMRPAGAMTDVNEPSNLRQVLACVASELGEPEETVAERTCRNACRVFGVVGLEP